MHRHPVLLLLALALGCSRGERTQGSASTAPPVRSAPATDIGTLLPVGSPAPDLKVTAHDGTTFDLRALSGKPVVVYFYPRDDTPGCTVEAQGIRDQWPELQKSGAVVVGVSTDDAASHRAFAEKHSLPFALLPDSDHRIAGAFGVPITGGVAKRVTFIIDRSGKVSHVFPAVKPRLHPRELVDALATL